MPTNRITLEDALEGDEYEAIDAFCGEHCGADALPEISTFLAERFAVELVLDSDIVGGFVQDHSNLPGRAAGLCRPRDERGCAVVFRACFAAGIPFTISAGRSNLTGSATPEGGVIVSTAEMLAPTPSVDESAMTVCSPVGTILEELRKAVVAGTGGKLAFPVDPTSRGDLAVGGAVACNASGFTPGEVGATRAWVQAIDFLFPEGLATHVSRSEVVSRDGVFILSGREQVELPVPRYARPGIKNASGPFSSPDGEMDFVDFVVGSEGIYGLVTGCTLKLAPRPSDYLDLFFSLPEERCAVALYEFLAAHLPGGLGTLSALEYFGVNCRKYMDHEDSLFLGGNPVGVYVQVPLTDCALEDAAEQWLELLGRADCGVQEDAILVMDTDRERALFLEARHSLPANSIEVVQRRGTYTIMTDTVVPPARFTEFLAFTHGLLQGDGMDYLAFGHLGDCHLHFMILPEQEQLAKGTELYDAIVARSAELGGVYSGEHGTGKRKRADFLKCYGPDAVEQVRRSKAVLDPRFLLNRGNVVTHE